MENSENLIIKLIYVLVAFSEVYGRYYRNLERFNIYTNGVIYTVDPKADSWHSNPVQAMVVNYHTGYIEYIGNNGDAMDYYTELSKTFDLKGKTVLPGFHDVHMHPLEAMTKLGGGCSIPKQTPPEDIKYAISQCKPTNDAPGWILGHGHSIEFILDHIENEGRPPKEIIDEIINTHPVILMDETSHSVWVNSMALKKARITKDTKNNPGGIIMKDLETGEPNGILFENAGNEIMDIAIASFGNQDAANYDALSNALWELKKNGITSICDARTYWKRNHHTTWKRVCDNNELTVRTVLGLWAYPSMHDTEQIQKLKDLHTNDYNSNKCFLKINEIKVYSDGIVDSTTAAMLEPYAKNLHLPGLVENIGMNYFTQDRLQKYFEQLPKFDFHIHAIGDRGVQEVLNAIEKTKEINGSRHRMTHLEIVNKRDIPRFKELGVIADFQVTGEFTLPGETRAPIIHSVGEDRAKDFIPVKSVADTGAVVTLSSDWDVSSLNPFISIQHATQRDQQSVSVKSAIEMRTVNAAYAMRQENEVGYLGRGMAADFIVVDKDILKIPVHEIGFTKVVQTVLQGQTIYQLDKK
ncbi:putative amidohydrolase YtcJ isoform X2 [Mytilus edulis]|uniref:putative amidohydrolase YtcJ isoform X1 n=1 Tax=Mytilus edulis TaxID=6550 RepID=UPI0039F132BE